MSPLALAASLSSRADSDGVAEAEAGARGLWAGDPDVPERTRAVATTMGTNLEGTDGLNIGPVRRSGGRARRLRGLLAPDLGYLAVALARQPLLVAPEIVVQPLDLLVGGGAGKRGLVQDVQLGDLRGAERGGRAAGRPPVRG